MAVVVAMIMCLPWPVTAWSYNNNYRYGKQQLAQKQYRYGNPTWFNGMNRVTDWGSPYDMNDVRVRVLNNNMRRPGSMNRYQTLGGNRQMFSTDDYFDTDAMDYAVVRYPSSGSGYYPSIVDLAAYDSMSNDDVLYDELPYGDHDPMSLAAAYYDSTAAINRYTLPQQQQTPPSSPTTTLNRFHPTDKIHKFRKVFRSNLVSPSNAFKSTKEQQLYDFWESMIQNNQNDMDQPDVEDTSVTSKLYQHLPELFQKIQRQQKQMEQRQLTEGRTPSVSLSPPSSSSSSSLSLPSSSFSLSSHSSQPIPQSSMAMSQSIPHESHFKQWANGSPLYKRSFIDERQIVSPQGKVSSSDDNEDVRQLEKLKSNNVTDKTTAGTSTVDPLTTLAVTEMTTMIPLPMANGGQREYVLPRPAGEKSNYEILMELLAQGRYDKNDIANNNEVSVKII